MSSPKPSLDDLRIERGSKPQKSSLSWLVPVIILLLLLAVGWWFLRPKVIEVRTAPVRELVSKGGNEPAPRTVLNASGYVIARRAATVSSKVTGKVIEVLIEEGMKVKEGQIVARLDDVNVKASLKLAEAQVDSAKSSLAETKARLKQANLELRRASDLVSEKIASQADFDRAEAEAKALAARLEQQEKQIVVAEKELAIWLQQLEDTIIRAPFTGVVTTKDAQPGEVISPVSAGGGFTRTGICTIVDMESLEVEIEVSESYINRVTTGQPVDATLDAYSDWKIPCKVIAIIPTADRQKSTVKVRVGFDKLDPRILPEMGVKVGFREAASAATTTKTATSRGVIVPKAAVRNQDGRDVLFVVQNGRAERRAVTIMSTLDNEATLGSGVSDGEKVIVEGPADLKDGARVKEKSL